jgi:peroxiredoxin
MSGTPRPSRLPLYLTLITAGVFIIGAAIMPLLIQAQEKALDSSGTILAPVVLNKTAPALSLTDIEGNPVSLTDQLGKVVLVNNWATWCPPCQAEMPELQAYFAQHAAQGFVILAIESGDPIDNVKAFIRQVGITFPVWLDPHGSALEAFQNMNLPSSYGIDRQGILRLAWTGPITRQTLEKYLTPFLEK